MRHNLATLLILLELSVTTWTLYQPLIRYMTYDYLLFIEYQCETGYAGDGYICGQDSDFDGFPDERLQCHMKQCRRDNCPLVPNSGQEDSDMDGIGDECDYDDDNDGWRDLIDNCPRMKNALQTDRDGDGIGDLCDNCGWLNNSRQLDADGDRFGDACDEDIDGDGRRNRHDNCPHTSNSQQIDTDADGIGNECDNCPMKSNPNQSDDDGDGYGNACDSDLDTDHDGVIDEFDNCQNLANSLQTDVDGDGEGNACDNDDDGDGYPDWSDNCPLIHNLLQFDIDRNSRGDVCEYDNDDDGIDSRIDTCPSDKTVWRTDFSKFDIYVIGKLHKKRKKRPIVLVGDEGRHIKLTSMGNMAIFVGRQVYDGFNFSGTFMVQSPHTNDPVGFVFSHQSPSRFYLLSWRRIPEEEMVKAIEKHGEKEEGLAKVELQVVDTADGPSHKLKDAIEHSKTNSNQTSTIWKKVVGIVPWVAEHSYHFVLQHRPLFGQIRLQVMSEYRMVVFDTGFIMSDLLAGGRIGLYSHGHGHVIWSRMQIKCDEAELEVDNFVERSRG